MQSKIPSAQWAAWLLAATVPAIFSIIGRNGWLTVFLTAIACGVLSVCILACNQKEMPQWLCVLELLWLTVLLGGLAAESAGCWTEADAFPAIPIILLVISALAAQDGGVRAGRTSAVLLWLVLPVLGIVFLAGTADRNWTWVRQGIEVPDGTLIALLLIPCLGLFLPRERSKKQYWICIALGVIAVIASVIMDAVVGEEVAQGAPNTFYEFSKSVTLFGVAERFEALVACALTGGWFALFTIILSAAHHLTQKVFLSGKRWTVWLCAAIAAGLMCILPNRSEWMAIGCLIFWGFLPVAVQGMGSRKNIGKK